MLILTTPMLASWSCTALLRGLSAHRALFLVLEDFHWSDAGTIVMLFHLAPHIAGSRILLIITYRPEDLVGGPAGGMAGVGSVRGAGPGRHPATAVLNEIRRRYSDIVLDLDRAAEVEGRPFIDAVLETEPNALGESFRRELYARTGGHPLFTLELLRDLQAQGGLLKDQAGRWQEAPGLDWRALPSRVDAVIAERIGRLDDPRHTVERYGSAWYEQGKLVSNGPFLVESREVPETITLTRNPGYHGALEGNLESIKLCRGHNDLNERLRLYEEGEVDGVLLWYLSGDIMERVRRYYAAEYVQGPSLWVAYLIFNTRQPPLDDVRVRRALLMAIDRDFLSNRLTGGTAPPSLGGLLRPGMPGHSPGLSLQAGLGHDPDAARRLLAAAGYPHGRGFPPITMVDPVLGTLRLATEYFCRAWERELGITVQTENLQGLDQLVAQARRGKMPAITAIDDTALYPDPDYFLLMNMRYWPTYWAPDGYWDLVGRARRSLHAQERLTLYRAAEELIIGEAMVAPIYYGWGQMLLKPWVRGYKISPICWWRWRDIVIEPH